MKLPSVLLADDHSVVLAGIRSLLGSSCELIGEVTDGRALVEAALHLRPDVIILDISMPVLNGIDAARMIRRRWPEAKLLFLSMHANPVYLREALEAGGCGYLLKSSAGEELLPAVQAVFRGQTYISSAFPGEVRESLPTSTGRPMRSASGLTERQREVLQLIAEGRSNKEVAEILHISVKTAEFHRGRIMSKLGVHTAAELATFAVRTGIVGE